MVSVLALSVTFGVTLFPFWHFVPPPPAGGVFLKEGGFQAPSVRGLARSA